ncbi:MAG: hypothetical protein U0794_06590 [Isosphaeraceae bacterium]
MPNPLRQLGATLFVVLLTLATAGWSEADDPPELNPFGAAPVTRADALPGYLELSDGRVHPGRLFLTREARLRIFDEQQARFREVPLRVVKSVSCQVAKEWVEREWRFKENANDQKVYTGRSYPAREYTHVITIDDGQTIRGPLDAIVYVQPEPAKEGSQPAPVERFLLHKRDKGPVGTGLKEMTYVRSIKFGDEALAEGQARAKKASAAPRRSGRPAH